MMDIHALAIANESFSGQNSDGDTAAVLLLPGLLFSLLLPISCWGQVFPPPQEVSYEDCTCALNRPFRMQTNASFSPGHLLIEEELVERFEINDTAEAKIILEQKYSDSNTAEAYRLNVSKDQIQISSTSAEGLFYGVQSLIQLSSTFENYIQCQHIHDWPDMPHRVIMDDISRGPLPNTDFIKSQIRKMARYKLNGLTFYIEDVVKSESHPSFSPKNAISLDEFAELSDYGKKYNVELIGSFQSLGHFEKILHHPQYMHMGATSRMLDPSNPAASQFLKDVYADLIPHFSSPYFNLNGDEAWDLNRGKLESLANSIGEGKIYTDHFNPLIEHVQELGKTPMLWADILLQYPQAINSIAPDVTLLTWEYDALPGYSDWIDPIVEKEFNFWVCPGVLNSNRLMPDYTVTAQNIDGFITEGFEKGASGMMLTIWDDGGRHFFNRDWLGVYMGAARSWNVHHTLSQSDQDDVLGKIEYTDPSAQLLRGVRVLGHLANIPPTFSMTNMFVTQQVVPDYNQELSIDLRYLDQILSIADSAATHFQQSPAHPELPFWRFTTDQIRLLATTKMRMASWASTYADLCKDQIPHPATITSKLEKLLSDVQGILKEWTNLSLHFKELWLSENRDHWSEEAYRLHQNRIASLESLSRRLDQAKSQYIPEENLYLPPPSQVQLDVKVVQADYMTSWLLSEPFSISTYEGAWPDFLTAYGGESSMSTHESGSKFGGVLDWKIHHSPHADQVDLKKELGAMKGAIGYAYAEIYSPVDSTINFSFGSNDGAILFLNGKSHYQFLQKRSLVPDESTFHVPVKKGKNSLLIKVAQWKGEWGFSLRILDEKIKQLDYKYFIQPSTKE